MYCFLVKTLARFVGRPNVLAGKTLSELAKHSDNFGVGHVFMRNSIEHLNAHKQNFYILTRVTPLMHDKVLCERSDYMNAKELCL